MKKKSLIVVFILMILILNFIFINSSECWNCSPKKCYFNLDCGIGCLCFKGRGHLQGNCISKR